MLQVISSPKERKKVIARLNMVLKADLAFAGDRTVGSRGGNRVHKIFSNGVGSLWAAPSLTAAEGVPRSWLPMGIFDGDKQSLSISLEINIAHAVDGRAAGVIAREPTSSKYYLLHNGGLAGGRKGVGRDRFLGHSAWGLSNLVEVYDGRKPACLAVMLGEIKPGLSQQIETYVREAVDFKAWVTAVNGDLSAIDTSAASVKILTDEFAGRGRRKSFCEIEYDVVHGDIIKALIFYRRNLAAVGEDVYRTALIDTCVEVGGVYKEIFELKTSTIRGDLYKAIGQLMVHGYSSKVPRLVLVVPEGPIAADVKRTIESLGIDVVRYHKTRSGFRFQLSVA